MSFGFKPFPTRFYLHGMPELDLFDNEVQRRKAIAECFRDAPEEQSRKSYRRYFVHMVVFLTGMLYLRKFTAMIAIEFRWIAWIAYVGLAAVFARWGEQRQFQRPLRLRAIEYGIPVCVYCGYALRGLPHNHERCPECGEPIDDAVRELMHSVPKPS